MSTGATSGPDWGRRLLRRTVRAGLLAVVLAVVGLVVPEASVNPTQVELTKLRRTQDVAVGGDRVITILAVGSDARPGQSMTRTRGDALQLVSINTRTHAASAIGIPRDSWVDVPGHGFDKINTALLYGGPSGMAGAVANMTGLRADYVMVSRFPFFEDMVNDIGGIWVQNPRPFSDPYLKPKGFQAGRIRLDGYGAMAFSRIRKGLPGGDFDRSANQQRTLRGIHGAIRARADEPGFIARGVMTLMEHTSTDAGPGELFRLAQAVASVEPGKVNTCVVRGSTGYVGAQSVVFPDRAQARRLGADARADGALRGC